MLQFFLSCTIIGKEPTRNTEGKKERRKEKEEKSPRFTILQISLKRGCTHFTHSHFINHPKSQTTRKE